jgi:hypothetical protein
MKLDEVIAGVSYIKKGTRYKIQGTRKVQGTKHKYK